MTNRKSIELLRVALWNASPETSLDEKDWREVIQFAHKQTLDGIIPDALQQMSRENYPSLSVRRQMISSVLQVEMLNKIMNTELLEFVKILEVKNIPYVLLKGQGVATYYKNPLHRTPGDIDLYIPKRFYSEANECMKAFGGIRGDESRHHIDYIARGIVWELHHSIQYFQSQKRNHLFMGFVDEALSQSPVYVSINEQQVRVLPPTINIVMLLSHILDHFLCQGIGLRQLCDYAMALNGTYQQIDRESLRRYLERLSLTRAYRVFGQLCMDYLGLSSGKLMLKVGNRDKCMARKVMEDCIDGGNFGKKAHDGRETLKTAITYYTRFFTRLIKFGYISPSEAILWPVLKFYRFITGKVHVEEKNSVLNVG